jgi:RNA polymerase sigma-70 factor (ECF subfamily)
LSLPARNAVVSQAVKYQAALTSYAYAILQDWGLAQDAVQDSFVVAMEKCGQLDQLENAYVWVRGIVRRQALDRRRRRSRQGFIAMDPELIEMIDDRFRQMVDEHAALKQRDEESALYECMSKLKPSSRDLVLAFYRDRTTHEELGRVLHKSVNAIRLALSRIRRSLRRCVKGQLAEMGMGS